MQARIKRKVPHATYIHCHAHRLNLLLVDSMRCIPELSDFFDTVQKLYDFISNSNPRHELFIKVQIELGLKTLELERTVVTRWFY